MNHGTTASIKVDPNGTLTVFNDRTTVTIQLDGTVSVSTMDPLQLVGDTLVKLDDRRVASTAPLVLEVLLKRLDKKA